jgi:hypothetical protein
MNDLDGGSYAGTAVERTSPADVRHEADDGQTGATDNRAGEEPGELLTRDEYAAHMDHDTVIDDALDEHIEEADLASVDAYDDVGGQTYEPLGRDEYTELTHHDTADHEGAPEHIEEADLTAIDAYYATHDRAASRAQDPGEPPGGTLTKHADDDADPPRTEDASGPDVDHAETPEADADRISALEAENAEAKLQIADLKAHVDRFEELLADTGPRSDGDHSTGQRDEDTSTSRVDELAPLERQNAKEPERRAMSNEAFALGAAVGGVGLTAVADIMGTTLSADATGFAASALTLAAAAVALARKRREAKNADRSKD